MKLVGVCWDSDTLACCLEFVENGSLEDWIWKARGKNHNVISWKKHLLMTGIECALGVQYLHHEQYWAEEEEVEDSKGETKIVPAGYRQCIIHRDLKRRRRGRHGHQEYGQQAAPHGDGEDT